LVQVCKNLKPPQQNIFKDLDEEDDDKKKLDPQSPIGKMVIQFMNIVRDSQLLYNLLITVNTNDKDEDLTSFDNNASLVNQQNIKI
jgi:hypothetical protein